jgi:chemotaxis protein MotB
MLTRLLLVLLSLLLTTGCVAKRKYIDLEAEYTSTKGELLDQINQLEGDVKALKKDLASADSVINSMEGDLRFAKSRIYELEGDKAKLLDDKAGLGAAIEEMERALRELDRRKQQAEARVRRFRDMLDRFQTLIDAGTLRVKMVDGRMVVELATDILFDSGSARLSKAGAEALAEVAQVLQSIADRRYQVEGHTDNVPIGSAKYPSNWELAAERALTVVKTMVTSGLDAERVSAASFGEFKPATTNRTAEGRTANRRIEIVVVPSLSELPGFEELKKL